MPENLQNFSLFVKQQIDKSLKLGEFKLMRKRLKERKISCFNCQQRITLEYVEDTAERKFYHATKDTCLRESKLIVLEEVIELVEMEGITFPGATAEIWEMFRRVAYEGVL